MAQLNDLVVNGSSKFVGPFAGITNMNGTLCLNSRIAGSWNEGIRVNRSTNGWACFVIGGPIDSTSGYNDNQWLIGTPPTATATRRLIISHGSISTTANTYFYASSAGDTGPKLHLGASGTITSGNADAVTGGVVYTAIQNALAVFGIAENTSF